MNHVGRSYFKYVVEYVLEQYRKIYRIAGGVELVPPEQKEIGYEDTFYNLNYDDQLGPTVQRARSEIG